MITCAPLNPLYKNSQLCIDDIQQVFIIKSYQRAAEQEENKYEELIRITEREGRKTVSARELHAFLGCTERFANWFERQLQFGFDDVETDEFVGCKIFNALANQELQDDAISIDMAKEVSMLQKEKYESNYRKGAY